MKQLTLKELNTLFQETLQETIDDAYKAIYTDGYKVVVDSYNEILTVNGIDASLLSDELVESLEEKLFTNQLQARIDSGERVELELENGKYTVRFEDGMIQGVNSPHGLTLNALSSDFVSAIEDKLQAEYGI